MKKYLILVIVLLLFKSNCLSQDSISTKYEEKLKSIIEYIEKDTFAFKIFKIDYKSDSMLCFTVDTISTFLNIRLYDMMYLIKNNYFDTTGISNYCLFDEMITKKEEERRKCIIQVKINNPSSFINCNEPKYKMYYDFYSENIVLIDLIPYDLLLNTFVSVSYVFKFDNNKIIKIKSINSQY